MRALINKMLEQEKKQRVVFILSTILFIFLIAGGISSNASAFGAAIFIGFIIWLIIFIKYLSCFVRRNNYKRFLKLSPNSDAVLNSFNINKDNYSKDSQIYWGDKGLFYSYAFVIIPYSEFAWVYIKEHTVKYGAKTQQTVIHTKSGKKYKIPCGAKSLSMLVNNYLMTQAPNIVVGYNKDNKKKYLKSILTKHSDAITYSHITREFGKGFLFSSQTIEVTEADIENYMSGARTDMDKEGYLVRVALFDSKEYRRIVRLNCQIPTFDSSDREYDSWHDLYLLQEKNGVIRAVYCTGGYSIAHIEGYAEVYKYPKRLKKFFK